MSGKNYRLTYNSLVIIKYFGDKLDIRIMRILNTLPLRVPLGAIKGNKGELKGEKGTILLLASAVHLSLYSPFTPLLSPLLPLRVLRSTHRHLEVGHVHPSRHSLEAVEVPVFKLPVIGPGIALHLDPVASYLEHHCWGHRARAARLLGGGVHRTCLRRRMCRAAHTW